MVGGKLPVRALQGFAVPSGDSFYYAPLVIKKNGDYTTPAASTHPTATHTSGSPSSEAAESSSEVAESSSEPAESETYSNSGSSIPSNTGRPTVGSAQHYGPPHPGTPLPYAAIIIPPLVVFALIGALLFCLHRRKRRRQRQQDEHSDNETPTPSQPEIREHRSDNPPTINFTLPPIILSSPDDENSSTYLPNLDDISTSQPSSTESPSPQPLDYRPPSACRSLDGTFTEPPPPYKADGSIHSDSDPPVEYSEIDPLPPLVAGAWVQSPFDDPEYEVDVADGMMYGEMQMQIDPFADPDGSVGGDVVEVGSVGSELDSNAELSDVP